MRLEHSFGVPVRVDQAWQILLDVERVAPCMPGATLTEHSGDDFAGTVRVKLGPVNLLYKGSGRFVERDETAHRVVIEASGRDSRSAGTAAATVTTWLHEADGGTRVEVVTELNVTGRPAQFGRGMLADVSGKLIGQFAECLAAQLAAESQPAPAAAPAPVAPAPAAPVAAEPEAAPVVSDVDTAAAGAAPAAPREAEPIDLLAITGIAAGLRRAVPYGVAFLAGALVGVIVDRLIR
jgi:carbon monoxide dehydrogenase subunit G